MTEPHVTRVQELACQTLLDSVMKRDVITVIPETAMTELGHVLRTRRISGTPVVKDDSVVGMISIDELINWLVSGGGAATVADHMDTAVVSVFADESVAHGIVQLAKSRDGRLPVVDRDTGKLVGIVTKSILITGLLKQMEKVTEADEAKAVVTDGQFFDLISADRARMVFGYRVKGGDVEHAGDVSSRIKKTLLGLKISPSICRRAAIAAYEAEMNLIVHTRGGGLDVAVTPEEIYLHAYDTGPGISDLSKAMEPGFSTAPAWVRELGFGAGLGLNNIRQCSDTMDIESTVGVGTHVHVHIASGTGS